MARLTQDKLKTLFSYDEETGVFTRKKATCNRVKIGDHFGSFNDQGYLTGRVDSKTYRIHHLAWMYTYGVLPKEIDHINGVRDDNRIANLRSVEHSENMKNIKKPKTNTSGYMGVCWHPQSSKWRVRFRSKGKYIHGGMFVNILDAVKKRDAMYKQYGFHNNHGRTAA